MGGWRIYTEVVERPTSAETDILDLTGAVEEVLGRSGVAEGMAFIFIPGSTAAVTTIEFESGVVNDLKRAIERVAPRGERYEHDLRWGDGNGYSHVRAAMMGPQLAVPVSGGKLTLGTWQQIVLCDFDNRPRRRKVMVRLMGEGV
jgi:secondary thiamine-phosphate synthase enzyme